MRGGDVKIVSIIVVITVILLPFLTIHPTYPLHDSNPQHGNRYIVNIAEEDVDLALEELAGVGSVTSAIGEVVVVEADNREELEALPYVKSVRESRRFSVRLARSTVEIQSEYMNRLTSFNVNGVDGKGVIIGFIDTGIDYRHPDFYFPNGTSKILYIWDHTVDGNPPEGFDYGYECSREEIQRGTCPSTDTNGHGTHVAAIAASSGQAPGGYKGVAPAALIIFVKTGRPVCEDRSWAFDEAEILDGVYYIVEKAEEMGLPVVINLSLGTDIGGHDGNSALEKALDYLVEQGKAIIVAAAGNSASDERHIMGRLDAGETEISWVIPPRTTIFSIALSIPIDNNVNELKLIPPDGEEITIPRKVYAGASKKFNFSVDLYTFNARDVWILDFNISNSWFWQDSLWKLKIYANNTSNQYFHAWIESNTCSFVFERFQPGDGYVISDDYTVSIPASARYVIAVGAYVSRSKWVNYAGEEISIGKTVGEIESFSSRGPTLDGRVKPDITAPGSVIIAAKPLNIPLGPYDVSEYYTPRRGTSMASPHVAGVVALILQLEPNISYEEVVDILRKTAREDRFTGEIPEEGSPVWGWGKLNAKIGDVVRLYIKKHKNASGLIILNNNSIISLDKLGNEINIFTLKNRATNITIVLNNTFKEDVRYYSTPEKLTLQPGDIEYIEIKAQYRVRIYDPDNRLLKQLWVSENATINVEQLLNINDAKNFFVQHRIGGLVKFNEQLIKGKEIEITGPTDIKVILLDDYTNLFITFITLASLMVTAYIIHLRRKYTFIRNTNGDNAEDGR